MEVRFIFKSSSGRPRVHSKRLPVVVGRSDDGDVKLRIPRDAISRRHCEFLLDESGRVCVRDLESTNGTYLEGRRLEPRVAVPVASGSGMKLGNVGFRVEYAAAAPGRSRRERDTTPIAAADESPSESGEPALPGTATLAEGLAVTEPAAAEPAVGEPAVVEPAGAESAADDFGFLAETAPAAPDADAAWPVGEQPAVTEDKNLEDFFKGLS